MTSYEMSISDWSADVCSSDLVPDPHPRLAEVDLQVMARRRPEPSRRPRRRLQLATPTRNTALDRAKAHRDPMFGRQLLAHHVGVAAVPEEPLAQPLVQPVEHRAPGRLAERRRAALTEVPPHRVPCATELASQALRTPTEPVQPNQDRQSTRLKSSH